MAFLLPFLASAGKTLLASVAPTLIKKGASVLGDIAGGLGKRLG